MKHSIYYKKRTWEIAWVFLFNLFCLLKFWSQRFYPNMFIFFINQAKYLPGPKRFPWTCSSCHSPGWGNRRVLLLSKNFFDAVVRINEVCWISVLEIFVKTTISSIKTDDKLGKNMRNSCYKGLISLLSERLLQINKNIF